MTTPTEGVNEPASLNDATDLFLSRWADAEDKPSDTDKGVTSQDDNEDDATVLPDDDNSSEEDFDLEDDSDDTDQSEDDANEDEENAQALEAGDDHKVKLTVDGEEKTVTVKELKRLYGQEASLTRKSQEVAQARKEAEQSGEKFFASSERLIAQAQARFKPFENIDWLVAQQKLTPDEFAALREEARDAYSQLTFLQSETDEVLKVVKAERQAELTRKAQESITILERDIPNWSKETYEQVCSYAAENGFPEVTDVVDASVIKFIHKAMRLDAMKAKALQKKTQAKAAPKRVVKPGSNNASGLGKNNKPNEGLQRLAETGSRDDAVAAFMERWNDSDNG